jgi:low temperature requirement protein LtrA
MLAGRGTRVGQAFLYAHVPLTAGVVMLGVGVEHAIDETVQADLGDATRWLLCGGIAMAFASLGAIHGVASGRGRDADVWLRLGVAAVALAIALLGVDLGALWVTAILAVAVVACLALELASHHRHEPEGEIEASSAFVP